MKDQFTANIVSIPKIKNGARIVICKNQSLSVTVDHHFNWFQKKMIKWCFGFDVIDYSDEE